MWASKWNDRAYYSCKKAGIGQEFVQMAVLVQRLVEAEYAFVIHTVNPSNNNADYMYAEVVVGLGETLVGNFPGRALGFQMRKDGTEAPEIQSLPSKSTGLFGGGLIFRSHSNRLMCHITCACTKAHTQTHTHTHTHADAHTHTRP